MTATQTREPAGTAPTTAGSLPLRIGSLCTGYGGLDMAVQQVVGGQVSWVADPDPGATAILAHHHHDVPNLGDIKLIKWSELSAVDIVTAGYPCQPFSDAGLQLGVEDERHIWPYIAAGIRVLRPRYVVLENVRGHLRRGFDVVLGDLADLGFDAEWRVVRASDVGAPHQRPRLIVLATAADAGRLESERWGGAGLLGSAPAAEPREGDQRERAGNAAGHCGPAPADSADLGHERLRSARGRRLGPADSGLATAHSEGGNEWQQQGASDWRAQESARGRTGAAAVTSDDWGQYTAAIRRWERILGRPAPRPTQPGRTGEHLSPLFTEWLMGLPAGHVTDVPGLSRNQQLKALGNGVVPQQGAAAIGHLFSRIEVAA